MQKLDIMNRKILVQRKAANVHKIGLLLFILFNLFSCASKKNQNKDYLIIESIIEKICSTNNESTIYFDVNYDNSTILNIYEENFKNNKFINNEKNKTWLSKGKISYSDTDILLISDVFTEENYNFIKDQIGQSYWNKEKIKISSCDVTFLNNKESKTNLSINRPVYTKNNYALIGYTYKI